MSAIVPLVRLGDKSPLRGLRRAMGVVLGSRIGLPEGWIGVFQCAAMPIYEFYSPDSNKVYSFLAKSLSYQDRTPRCPDDPSFRMERRVSNFAFIGKAKEPSAGGPDDDLDDAQMEKVMAEMERDLAGFDEDNPDPRQMAHVMRKMADLTGEKLPGEMEEMVRRLELGEDPEKLEEEYGDAFDAMDEEMGGEGGGEEGDESAAGRMKRLRRRLLGPKRDPNLYDMGEYCE